MLDELVCVHRIVYIPMYVDSTCAMQIPLLAGEGRNLLYVGGAYRMHEIFPFFLTCAMQMLNLTGNRIIQKVKAYQKGSFG